ncbi:MAG: Asp-tRNA(Asn)/Glu-tRNA(Gln) amidotransferase subunit GatA [Candidatus Omnitrophica bacterium]|nr:Asp-tRNA(Asn)/Glu-tRNA(Gln) amidotransferase subunit GatA [Candidatus Omnitrophota bacterium]MCM8777810.1 Asp-tRNA(Asn)/Glu-tRNA(Gln) amidotransferase subunit GatA [Candidatus Omnitrophota bacterium]
MDILNLKLWELKTLIERKEISSVEITEKVISEIENRDKEIHSYLSVNPCAVKEAEEIDKKITRGEHIGLLGGIPVAIKDNICVKEMPATCASKILEGFFPPYNATVIDKIKNQGAIIIGKTNMDEFAFGSSTENSSFGPTKNPIDLQRVPGGSSGGSAAAVSANLCFAALGSDTGGSIRQPASFCGVVGLKPTYGRVSRYGLIAFASSLDQIGPITKDVRDTAIMMNVICGRDENDSTSVDITVPDYTGFLNREAKGLKIGIPDEYFIEGIDRGVKDKIIEVVEKMEDTGMVVKKISLPHTRYGIAVYYILGTAEASSNLARFDGVRYGYRTNDYMDLYQMYANTREEGFGKEVKRRIILGTFVLSSGYYEAYYLKAQRVCSLIKKDFTEAFKEVDVIITPTSPELPFKFGEKAEPLKMYLSDIFTVNVNLAGLPAISIPAGFVDNLPVGLQIIAPHFREDRLIEVASFIENCIKGA